MRRGPKFIAAKLIEMKFHVSGMQSCYTNHTAQENCFCFNQWLSTCSLFQATVPLASFTTNPLLFSLITNGLPVMGAGLQRIIAVDTFKHHLSVWYITRGIGSCLLKVSVVECHLIALVDFTWALDWHLSQHSIDISINTWSTLVWHLLDILNDMQLTSVIKIWSMGGQWLAECWPT